MNTNVHNVKEIIVVQSECINSTTKQKFYITRVSAIDDQKNIFELNLYSEEQKRIIFAE